VPDIGVLLVDDHELVLRGFRRILEDESDIYIAGEANDGLEAVERAAKLRPAVVVMDFALPIMNGAIATRQILKDNPGTAVLILSMHSEPCYVRICLDAGARGYLLKNAMDLELVRAVRQVAAGGSLLDCRLGSLAPAENPRHDLTTRELEVLQLIVHGKSNKDIAAVLGVSSNTVAVHRANIMQNLDAHNTAETVVYAIRNGLVTIT
jgi:DNA-binding NarL/FixJ family response regulator